MIPDRVAGHTGRRLDRHDALASGPSRLRADPGDGHRLRGALRARRLRGLQDAYRMSQGEEYRYPFVADLVEGR
jgi:hypothetical protein